MDEEWFGILMKRAIGPFEGQESLLGAAEGDFVHAAVRGGVIKSLPDSFILSRGGTPMNVQYLANETDSVSDFDTTSRDVSRLTRLASDRPDRTRTRGHRKPDFCVSLHSAGRRASSRQK